MNLAPPIPRFGRTPEQEAQPETVRGVDVRRTANRSPAKNPAQVLQRERHQPDYMILVVVVALSAIGILMVYSSSAMRGYLNDEDTFATVGPQIQWALLGVIAMVGMMRIDYRYLRLASIPFLGIAVLLLVLVFVDQLNVVVGGSARWLKLARPAGHPPRRGRQAGPRRLSRPLVRQARHQGARVLGRDRAVPHHPGADLLPGVPGAGPRHDVRHRLDGVDAVLRGRCQSAPPRAAWRRRVHGRDRPGPAGLSDGSDPDLAEPVAGGPRCGFPYRPGPARAGRRWDHRARPWAEHWCPSRMPSTTSSSPRSARNSG